MTDCGCRLSGTHSDIWMCPHHIYRKGDRRFTSVTKVIKAVSPSDYSMISPIVLETARVRGCLVEEYFYEWLASGCLTVDFHAVRADGESRFWHKDINIRNFYIDDTIKRIAMLCDWWLDQGFTGPTEAQKIVYSEVDGIAGTLDLRNPGLIMDIKCTHKLYDNYHEQLGAYSEYSNGEDVGILWVPRGKVQFVPYDAKHCRQKWLECKQKFQAMRIDP